MKNSKSNSISVVNNNNKNFQNISLNKNLENAVGGNSKNLS